MVKSTADRNLEPHAVMVLGSKGSFCSAVVLKQDVLLTAAHCVTGSSDYRVHWRGADGTPILEAPAAITIHPGYAKDAAQARKRSIDLALIKLKSPLPTLFDRVKLSDIVPRTGDKLSVAGYGLGNENDPATSGVFRVASLGVIEPYGPSSILVWLTDPTTGPKSAGAGACTGDSGGPIFDTAGSLVAVTVYAEGPGKARCGALTQGLLIKPQRAFIDATLKKWNR
jgi:S1-C subfamily serine protease